MKRALPLVLLVCCNEALPTPVAPVGSTPAPSPIASSAPPTEPVRPTAITLPAPIEVPPSVCVLRGPWSKQPRTLAFRAGGKPFASVHGTTNAELALPTQGRDAFAKLSTSAVRAEGFVPGAALTLHASKPILLAGFVAPGPSVSLRWTGVKDGRVSITMTVPGDVKVKTPPAGDHPCGDLSLGIATFAPREAISEPTVSGAMLPSGRTIGLTMTAGGVPIAEMRFAKDEEPMVDVLATSGPRTRVVVYGYGLDPERNLVLVGWVPTAMLRQQDRASGGSWGDGGEGATSQRAPKGSKRVSCPTELPLIAELEGEARSVGALAAAQAIDILAPDGKDDLAAILVTGGDIAPEEGARLLTRRSGLDQCTPATR